jgi:Fe-S oxidoreductase
MPLPIKPILGILSDNLSKRGSVLPLSRRASTGWSKGLGLPRGGETVLYTGHMYQLIPAIDAMSSQMAMFENSPITKFFGLGRIVNKFINMSFFMSLTASREMKAQNNKILRQIATLLQGADVSFGYLYEAELYSGALVFDQGMDAVFEKHARRVFDMFRKHGVRNVITVDPHTTHMLREVYPRFIPEFDINVQSYLEVLADKAPAVANPLDKTLVVHDSCVYARYEGMIDPPRTLLEAAGVTVKEPELCRTSTHCCGGPIEALFPTEAHRIAKSRIEQLAEAGDSVATMCPICWVNLRKAGARQIVVKDISETLAEAYG